MAETGDAIDDGEESRIEEIRARYSLARDHASKWRAEARECYAFYAGEQWSEDDKEVLRAQLRPVIVFNRTAPLIDAVLGHEANNRTEIRYMPRTMGDAGLNEKLTAASQFFIDECDGDHEISDSFRDMLVSGMGWGNTRLDDKDNEEYDPKVERIDPLEMLWDPSSKKPNLADARYIFREKRMSREEIKERWPDVDLADSIEEWSSFGDVDDDDIESINPRTSYTRGSERSADPKNILVLEYQWCEAEPYYMVMRPDTGEQGELDVDAFRERKNEIEGGGLQHTLKRRYKHQRAFVIGSQIIQEDAPYPKGFTYHCITGKRDRNKGHWFGLVRSLMDPQRWANKWLSQILHILNSNSKGGVMAEKSAVDNINDFEAKWASADGVVYVADDALAKGRIQEKPKAVWPTGFDKLLEYANQSFGDVTGINAELLGMADREQPGVLEWQRKQSAVTLLAPLFDSLRRFRMIFGRCWLYFIQTYVSDGRLIRITTDDGEQYIPLTPEWSQAETAKYDVVVDQAATAPNQKEATWAVLTTLLPAIKEMLGPNELMLALEYSPLPDSLMQKLKQLKTQQEQQPPPPDPEMVKIEQQAQLEQVKLQASTQQKQAELQLKAQEAELQLQIEREKLELERQKAEAELAMKQQEMQADIAMQQHKLQADLQLQRAKGEAEMEFQRQKSDSELDLQRHKADGEMEIKAATALHDMDGKMNGSGDGKPKRKPQVFKAFEELGGKLDQLAARPPDTAGVAEAISSLAKEMQTLKSEMSRPKKIIRGKDGRAERIVLQ